MSGIVVFTVDPTNGPYRVELESARVPSAEHCTHGYRHWDSDTSSFGEPQVQRSHKAGGVFGLRNCCVNTASLH